MPQYLVTSTVDATLDAFGPDPGTLRAAIFFANEHPGTTITFASSLSNQTITLIGELPLLVGDNTVIDGGTSHITVSGDDKFRPFFIGDAHQLAGQALTHATIQNLTIAHAAALGGEGNSGGAGLGGAVFVSSNGALTLANVSLLQNSAVGGDGGGPRGIGGGGGMGGNGGIGGGGFGNGADGGGEVTSVPSSVEPGVDGSFTDLTNIADSGGSIVDILGGQKGGGGAGGAAAWPHVWLGAGGGVGGGDGEAGDGGFGGGGGTHAGAGLGGDGGFGGGGGAGVKEIDGFAKGGGGAEGRGGAGGFGGGGGGSGEPGFVSRGGFGGGDGDETLIDPDNSPLTGSGLGGGGAGMGGAVFVMGGGSLTVAGALNINGNTVAGGDAPEPGSAFGAGLFLGGSGTLVLQPGANETQTIANAIADQNGEGGALESNGVGGLGGAWGLTKSGAGTLVLSGTNTYSGNTTVSGGLLQVDGTLAKSLFLTVQSGGTLGGTGTTRSVTVQSGGVLAPGDSPGTLHMNILTMSAGATLAVEFNGTAAGQFDQVAATLVDLGNATLYVAPANFSPAVSTHFRIIDNTLAFPVTGTFAGLPEGATFTAGTTIYGITYTGGDGNDVDLVALGLAQVPIWRGRAGANDTLPGGAGNDWYFVNDAGDTLNEPGGQGSLDRVFSHDSYTLPAGAEIENFCTDDHAGTNPVALTGNELGNLIYGNAGNNTLNGMGGDDLLIGFGGTDILAGGEGNDRLIGGTGDDFLIGNEGDDILFGRTGFDILVGGTGNDWYMVDGGASIVEAPGEGTLDRVFASVSYVLSGGAEIEKLSTDFHAGTTAINLTGNDLANQIFGNAGPNVIRGMAGNDQLWGFGGSDTFAFDLTPLNPATNVDRIGDFDVADDHIRLGQSIFAALPAGALAANAFVIGSAAQNTSQHIIYDSVTGVLSYDADGSGNASAAVQFATLGAGLALTEANFVVL